jgi:hypothetical protein
MISSRKVMTPPTFPTLPLYILVIKYAAIGAQITSENSPNIGTVKDSIPMASNKSPRNKFLIFSFLFTTLISSVAIFLVCFVLCAAILVLFDFELISKQLFQLLYLRSDYVGTITLRFIVIVIVLVIILGYIKRRFRRYFGNYSFPKSVLFCH